MKVNELLEAQELMPAKAHESTVNRLAVQLLKNACKHFHGDRELVAAKQMAADFYKRLVQNIEDEYGHMKMKDIKEDEFKLSLTEKK